MTIVRLDGVRLEVLPPDLNKDGIRGGVEQVSEDTGVVPITNTTELGDSLKQLNDDSIEPHTRMSGIDMRARLHYAEEAPVLAVDTLVALKILPTSCLAFTRQKKRLSVSRNGLGRQEIVRIVGGKQDQDIQKAGGSLADGVKKMFGFGGQQQ